MYYKHKKIYCLRVLLFRGFLLCVLRRDLLGALPPPSKWENLFSQNENQLLE